MRSSLELFKRRRRERLREARQHRPHRRSSRRTRPATAAATTAREVRRGVFLDNFVYSISYGGIVAKDANNLAGAGSKLALPSPQVNTGYGPVCDGGGAVPPSAGAGL